MAELQDILNGLGKVLELEGGYQAHCPCHDDKRKSLSISMAEDDKILIHCHAGCKTEDVVTAIGFTMADLFPKREQSSGTQKRVIVQKYDYHSPENELLYQVCRTADKGFFQRRPNGKGGYENGLKGVEPVLYHLPSLMEAVEAGQTIFIPEGEKDVDRLNGLGLAATTSPMGAGKWRQQYSTYLQGASVVILPDNDQPGRNHAAQVAASLQEVADSVKVLELPDLPEKGDISDWLDNGNSLETLTRLAEEAPVWEPQEPELDEDTDDEAKSKKKEIRKSFIAEDGLIVEQIQQGRKSKFIAYDVSTGEISEADKLETDEEIILPLTGDDVTLQAIKLPTGTEDYGSTLALIDDIKRHIHKYLDVSSSYLIFASFYVLLSWLYDRFHTLPYLRALGDTGTGKSRFLDVIGGLLYKSISASGCVTPAPIYRMLKRWAGSLVLDEADMKSSDEFNEVVTILNCGFEKGRPVIRANKDNPDNVQILPVYGPKVFATRRRFKDAALEARSLTEIMQETSRDDIPPVLGRQFHEEQQLLINKLLNFRLRNYLKVETEGQVIDLGDVEPRLKQISQAFLSLFSNEPEVLDSYKKFIMNHQRELVEQRSASPTGQVVGKVVEMLAVTTVTTVTTGTGQSVECFSFSAGDIAEKVGLTAPAVGSILKGLGIKTERLRIDGKQKRCIIRDDKLLTNLIRRYIPLDEREEALSRTACHSRTTCHSDEPNAAQLHLVAAQEANELIESLAESISATESVLETDSAEEWLDVDEL